MDLTAHFYRTEEVTAALIHAISGGQKDQAFFWAQELIDSGMTHLLIFNLVWTYAINYSHRRLDWVTTFANICFATDIIDEEKLQEAVQALLAIPSTDKDGSFVLTAINIPKKEAEPTVKPVIHPQTLHVLSQKSEIWLGVPHKEMQAVLDHLHWLASTQCQLVEVLPSGRGLCLSHASLESHPLKVIFRPLTDTRRELLDSWQAILGRRARRIFAIPSGALYAMTARGPQPTTETTIEEIRNSHNTFHLSYYWSAICPQTLRCDEDPVWEQWLNTIFLQDDIPEEWSKEDQLKSHGPGLCAKATIGGWLWRCVPHDSIAAPGWFESIARRYEKTELNYPQTIQCWLTDSIQETLLQRSMSELNMEE
jgi:hypothetical protein